MSIPRSVPTSGGPDGPWWQRPGLSVRPSPGSGTRLVIGGADAEELARTHGTPLFVYDVVRVEENARRLQSALARAGLPFIVRFALKANREPAVLARLRGLGEPGGQGGVGIDACSPGEVEHAIAAGWRPEEISYTGTNVSERDLDTILPWGIHMNLDAISQLERVGRRAPGRAVGLRVNPAAGAGFHARLSYSGERPTKFGIFEERLSEALATAARHRLSIDTVHFHAGSGWLGGDLPAFERAVEGASRMARRLIDAGCPIREVNVGGGLGVPARPDEQPIDLDAYAAILQRHLADLVPRGVSIACEPGDFIVKDAAILLGEVVVVEARRDVTFIGLDLGWNVNCLHHIYGYTQEIVPCLGPDAPRTQAVTVAGHINEAGDLFAQDYPFPPIEEGAIVAILNAGGYAQAMTMQHCMRPAAGAVFVERR